MLLSIIIINYKTAKVTTLAISSIYKHLKSEIGNNVEIILVDNGSGDEEVKTLQELRDRKGFKFLTSKVNLGFGGGCNLGTDLAEGKNLLFLNSDTKIFDNSIIKMAQFLRKQEKIGILGGRLTNERGVVEKSAGKFYNLFNLFLMLIGGEKFGIERSTPSEIQNVDWVSGGFMMVKKKAFEKIGGFDESYFMYLEDMDLCLRAKKEGFSTNYYPSSSVSHSQHGSSGRGFAIYNIYKSLKTFYKKNKSGLTYNIAIVLLYLKASIAYFLGKMTGRKELTQTYSEVLKLF